MAGGPRFRAAELRTVRSVVGEQEDGGVADTAGSTRAWDSDRPAIRWGAYAWALVGFGLAFLLLWRGLGYVRLVLVPLSLALFPAAVLTPVAAWLERRGVPPALAAFAVVAVFVVALLGVLVAMGVQIQAELSGIAERLRDGYADVQQRVDLPFLPDPQGLTDALSGSATGGEAGSGAGSQAAQAALAALRTVAEMATQFFLFLVAAFFYIKDRDAIADWIEGLFPDARRDDAREVGSRMWDTVSSYVRGQTMIAAFDGTMVAIGLLILGVPLAIVLGGLVFFGAFVPVVGSVVAGAVAVTVALATNGLTAALITLGIVIGVQQLEGNVLAPYVLSRELSLHPLVVLTSITVGAVLLGAWGALIAVPVAASLHRAAAYVDAHHRAPA